MTMPNIFSDLPADLPEELVEVILQSNSVRIERIVAQGHASPPDFWYDQDENEWVLLMQGAARLRFNDAVIEMKPGDFINIPAHRKHRVDSTAPDEITIWLALFY